MEFTSFIIPAIIILLFILIISCIKIVPQAHVYVIERLGTFHAEWQTGIHFMIPFIDKVAGKVSLKEKVVDFKPQPVITKDNVTMQIDTVVFYQVTNAKQYIYGVERPLAAIENLSATTLRNIIGEMELDATLTSRDIINTKITAILDQATDRWGIKVNRVELKNILPPREIQDAMEKQMKAERERREKILQAEGDKKSQVLVAEGEKESQILRAQAKKEAQILAAEAEKQAMILKADAVREKKILEATGEAQAIELVQQAKADALAKLNAVNPNEKVLKYKAIEAFPRIADGKATKIIIPSEMQGIAGLAAGLQSIVEKDETPEQ
ncbi:MAG: SPFH/Band 7/PHB domain protein [Ruminococcus sp.]|nr:SPFH/Band 7/PHB domain protein [Ruminococcus sp.]